MTLKNMKMPDSLSPANFESEKVSDFSTTRPVNNLVFAAFCLTMSILISYFLCPTCRSDSTQFLTLSAFSFCLWISLWPANAFVARRIDRSVSWIEAPGKRFILGVLSTIITSMVILFLTIWFFDWALDFSLGSNLKGTIMSTLFFTIICSLFLYGQEFLMNWRKLELDSVKMRNENLSSRYESLKNQLDPHFLFNSLNVLTNLVYEDPDKSARFIKQLSEVYRYVIDMRGKEFVTIQEELQFVKAYLYLQQIRFGDKLVVHNKLEDTTGYVPPLVIQMLVENAIKHNTISNENPLFITLYESNGNIIVENNLQAKESIFADSLGVGLNNIKKRYELLSSKLVNISRENGKFKVDLPVLTIQEN
ncbi:MAG: histidine kinase [Chryseolinea sp.]